MSQRESLTDEDFIKSGPVATPMAMLLYVKYLSGQPTAELESEMLADYRDTPREILSSWLKGLRKKRFDMKQRFPGLRPDVENLADHPQEYEMRVVETQIRLMQRVLEEAPTSAVAPPTAVEDIPPVDQAAPPVRQSAGPANGDSEARRCPNTSVLPVVESTAQAPPDATIRENQTASAAAETISAPDSSAQEAVEAARKRERADRSARRRAVVMPILEKKHWKPGRLATKAGVGKNSIYRYLDGTRGKITDDNRKAIAQVLDLQPEQLPD